MLFSPLAWAMLTLTLLVTLPGALAAPMAKRGKKTTSKRVSLEVYPALEEGEMEEELVQTTRVPVDEPPPMPSKQFARPLTMRKSAATKVKPSRPAIEAKAPDVTLAISDGLGVEAPVSTPMMEAAAPIRRFEEVPAEKRAQVLKRMQLCEALLKVSGRAYDYRKMTTAHRIRSTN